MDKKRNRKLINWLGLTGIVALLSYAAAVVFSPLAYPGYNWMAQAVSDLSAETAPSRMLWNQMAALYGKCSLVSVTCVSIFISEKKISTKLFRIGVYLFAVMNWISGVLRGTGILAAAALIMMMVGAIGQGAVPTQYFGIVERFSVFAAVGFNAVLGVYLFKGFGER